VFGEPHEDALRRDFRINGLFYDLERQEVVDFVGGMTDVEARVLDTIGLPDVRFREDPVRILRAIKFSARLDVGIDPECYDAMVAQREELRKAAKARLFEEVLRLLRGGAAHRSVWLAWETGVLAVLVPQVSAMLDDEAQRTRELWRRLDAIDAVVAQGRVPSDTVLLAAFLTGAIEEALEGAEDPLEAYEELMAGLTELLALPRRIKERMRVVIGCQRRLRTNKLGTLPQREFWKDALDLYEIECLARGIEPTLLATDAARLEPRELRPPEARWGGEGGGEGKRRRRRRR
jgi:poly(A) polymerase